MEVRLDALAFLVQRVHFIATAVDLDPTDLPAFFLQLRLELGLRLPGLLRAGVAGGESGGERRRGHHGRKQRERDERTFHSNLLRWCRDSSAIVTTLRE